MLLLDVEASWLPIFADISYREIVRTEGCGTNRPCGGALGLDGWAVEALAKVLMLV